MREILFKAKRIDNGEWVEGYLYKKYFQELPHDRFVIEYKTTGSEYEWTPKYMVAEIEPETLCQYTGLTDKNGNKIWENDVVKHGLITETVILKDGSFGVYSNGSAVHLHVCHKYIEVIGNIFDNPELLKGE